MEVAVYCLIRREDPKMKAEEEEIGIEIGIDLVVVVIEQGGRYGNS